MPIPRQTEYIIPAAESKTYPDEWVSSLRITCPSTSAGRIHIEALPYDSATGEIADGGRQTLITDDLWLAVAEVPEVAQAFGAIIAAVAPLRDWIAARAAAAAAAQEEIIEE